MSGNSWRVSGYTEVRELGSGASGRVVLATHDATGTPVAVKYLVGVLGADPAFRDPFRAEARLLADIDDPHVSRLYEYVESTAGAAIVMELVNGVSLRQMLRANGPTGPQAALRVLKGSLAGLAAAHARGVVHRDYKPENVLVTAEGESKLADFGIAMPVGRESATMVTGTPRYMAPEQWTGAAASPACDIYAATATFFECLTGHPPYDGRSLLALREQHAYAPIPTDPAPPPVHELLRWGMAKLPAERPQPAHVFLGILEQIATEGYGADWEEHGGRELARRAALLAALFPFPDASGGGTSLASTVLVPDGSPGTGRQIRTGRRMRTGRARPALIGGALAAAVLVGGVGWRYASGGEPDVVAVVDDAAPVVAPAAVDPASGSAAPPSVTPTPTEATPTPSAVAPTTGGPTTAVPTSRPPSPTGRPTRTATPTASAGSTPSAPPPDVTAPTVGSPSIRSITLEPRGCPYGATSTPVTVTVTDDRSAADALRVSFRYTAGGQSATVVMSSVGKGVFEGTLGPFDRPADGIRIPVQVTAVDAAGNSAGSGGAAYVSLQPFCTPG
ncbi:Serine/threonine-protein kinase StkP [Micromonospora sp. MW-13]|uniref:serine/threonine-protein kinase n=1 Tax=unclassified Micromonospora TaxID=2617518 RepID=UPI000E43E9A6|nr:MULTISPECIES: serine/threonine-protein kinase [unclassified Micromonospora]MCX4472256.1 serine/threonine protein kinase [Micromonospora sp. NBC_01655]RGC65474.1 Serine/threonine-protein kinase StkP [Micromonospora sp. MW-13]